VVKRAGWAVDSLDAFALAKMEALNLEPNAAADPATLLRRVSLLLNGLPPSPEQMREFAKNPSAAAYEAYVDGLLASPRYGERMAQEWLDVARFADTYGYQTDKPCFTWPWRDWVIKAFNENMRYDEFAMNQIAGDMLPNATQDQRLATMFNRLHRQTEEGGSIEAEFRQEYVSDRVHTYGTAFLGLTMECSRCHDHKYDPIPQADYYSMASMFGQIDECGLLPYSISTSAPPPYMHLLEEKHEAEVEKRRAALADANRHWEQVSSSCEENFQSWLAKTTSVEVQQAEAHYPMEQLDGDKLANVIAGKKAAAISKGSPQAVAGAVGQAMEFDGDTLMSLDGVKGVTRHDELSVNLHIFCPDHKDRAVILHSGPGLYSQSADASGFELLLEKGKLRWSCIALWPGDAASIETVALFPVGKWVQVTVTYDGSSRAAGLRMYFDGTETPTSLLRDNLRHSIVAGNFRIAARPRDDRGFAQGKIDELKLYRNVLTAAEVAALAGNSMERTLELAKRGDARSLEMMCTFYTQHIDHGIAAARKAAIEARKELYDNYLERIPVVMCMEETAHKKQFHILTRGDYASPDLTKPVQSGTVSAVMPFDEKQFSRDRLGLARWTVHSENPLTARVAVNRLWMMCFGAGIVPTQENFGLQGDAPTHQEMLDTLSREFMESGWNVKKLLKRIVMSSTFRQSSTNTAKKAESDPKNLYLSRGPSYRLSGEAIRDQALFASGLLVEKIGGPSVKPWQPNGVWSESGASGGDYVPDQGDGRFRRSIYTFIKRTAPPPNMATLDAGSREICQPRRLTTNTPLQPLIFLNDLAFFECARKLAERCEKESAADPQDRITYGFTILTGRLPRPAELDALQALYVQQLDTMRKDQVAAAKVSGRASPEHAALTLVCSTMLTADAAITNR
jgi:hypothetical protein